MASFTGFNGIFHGIWCDFSWDLSRDFSLTRKMTEIYHGQLSGCELILPSRWTPGMNHGIMGINPMGWRTGDEPHGIPSKKNDWNMGKVSSSVLPWGPALEKKARTLARSSCFWWLGKSPWKIRRMTGELASWESSKNLQISPKKKSRKFHPPMGSEKRDDEFLPPSLDESQVHDEQEQENITRARELIYIYICNLYMYIYILIHMNIY